MIALRSYMGFLLGLVGLSFSTWGLLLTGVDEIVAAFLLLIWLVYMFIAYEASSRGFRLAVVVGLLFLIVPLFLVGGYNSAHSTQLRVVNVQRTFLSSPSPSVLIALTVQVLAPFGYFPVTITNPSFHFTVYRILSGQPYGVSTPDIITTNGGTFYPPLSNLSYRLVWNSSDTRVIDSANQTGTLYWVTMETTAASGIYGRSIVSGNGLAD